MLAVGVGAVEVGAGSVSAVPAAAAPQKPKCSGWRGNIKRLGDPAAGHISNTIRSSSVKSLRQLPPVNLTKADRRAKRISPVERTISAELRPSSADITDSGMTYLDFWAKSLEQYQRTMDTFFKMYTGRPPIKDDEEETGE